MRCFKIDGEPAGKGRPRFAVVNGKVNARTPDGTVAYENLVRLMYRMTCDEPMYEKDVPLVVKISAYFGIPKSTSKKRVEEMLQEKIRPTKKPDVDNIEKIVLDSLNKIAFYDDSQIVSATTVKYYSKYPRVFVQIWTLEEYDKILGRL